MKTPREIILERHRSVEDKLAATRPEELATLARRSASNQETQTAASNQVRGLNQSGFVGRITVLFSEFWRQSIYPWRRVWAGIAAAWLGIVALNFGSGQMSSSGAVQAAHANPQIMAVLYEQRHLLSQLLGPVAESTAARPKLPTPRSERRLELFCA